MVYIVTWLASWVTAIAVALRVKWSRLLAHAVALAIAFLIVFRGPVGTDTSSIYEPMAAALGRSDWTAYFTLAEPGFTLLLGAFYHLTGSEVAAVRLVGAVFVACWYSYLAHANRHELLFFLLAFVPGFVFYLGMNALRIGIAVALVMKAMQLANRGRRRSAALLLALAPLFHYSTLILLVLTLVFTWKGRLRWRDVVLTLVGLVSFLCVSVVTMDYLERKLALYRDYPSPSAVSGLSDVVSGVLLVAAMVCLRLGGPQTVRVAVGGTLALLAGYALGQLSYAGLRVLELVVVALALTLMHHVARRSRFGEAAAFFTVAAGLAMAAFSFRNFLASAGMPGSPYLPYVLLF